MLLREIAEEARHQHEVAETELGVEGGNPLGNRLRTADDRHFSEPAIGVVLFFGQDSSS